MMPIEWQAIAPHFALRGQEVSYDEYVFAFPDFYFNEQLPQEGSYNHWFFDTYMTPETQAWLQEKTMQSDLVEVFRPRSFTNEDVWFVEGKGVFNRNGGYWRECSRYDAQTFGRSYDEAVQRITAKVEYYKKFLELLKADTTRRVDDCKKKLLEIQALRAQG